jgi:hypothetical protein
MHPEHNSKNNHLNEIQINALIYCSFTDMNKKQFKDAVLSLPIFSDILTVQKGEKSNRMALIAEVCEKVGGGDSGIVIHNLYHHTRLGKRVGKENLPPPEGMIFFKL